MPNLLAMSFEGELAPSFDLRCLQPGHKLPDGWGIGYYPGGEPCAPVLKESAPPHGSIRGELARAWEHLESSLFVVHIRKATWGSLTDANTQPFSRSLGGRDWLMAHSGSLRAPPPLAPAARFEPVGSTDTERIFCELLERIASRGWRSLGEVDPLVLSTWLGDLNDLGVLSLVLTDGRDLAVYADRGGHGPLHLWRLMPPYERAVFGDFDLVVDLGLRGSKHRKGIIVASEPLMPLADLPCDWEPVPPGRLVIVRQGAILHEIDLAPSSEGGARASVARLVVARPQRAEPKVLEIRHRTAYRYDRPVERSSHLLRLFPVHDRLQTVHENEVTLSVGGQTRDFDDVFGNRARRALLDAPYTELVIEARSIVEVTDTDPLDFRPFHARTTIPLVWMPWQRHMLQPYLLPPELPDTQLLELTEYAMSFVERNDYDVLDTLLDLNRSIFKEYRYRQGATHLFTTPFEVYATREGVCQDFTNLFICLARLLSIPARYVCGYVYTGPKAANQAQGEASHAWVQVYLPEVGWKGFDPTNGVLTQTDHVRVAVGRNFVDATPTSGTIYLGGGRETLEVDVRVEPIAEPRALASSGLTR